jgi:hypothetical protein
MVLGLHFYVKDPAHGPGPLTTSRCEELAKIVDRDQVQRLVGATMLKSDFEAAFLEFVSYHAIPGITQWCMFVDRYRDSGADRNSNLPHSDGGGHISGLDREGIPDGRCYEDRAFGL